MLMTTDTGGLHWAHNPDKTCFDLKKLVNSFHVQTHQMCCICWEYIPVEDLWVDEDGTKWDVCPDCHKKMRPLR